MRLVLGGVVVVSARRRAHGWEGPTGEHHFCLIRCHSSSCEDHRQSGSLTPGVGADP